jgi:hypothetical protein
VFRDLFQAFKDIGTGFCEWNHGVRFLCSTVPRFSRGGGGKCASVEGISAVDPKLMLQRKKLPRPLSLLLEHWNTTPDFYTVLSFFL